ncbi:MAG: hypothetical protein MUE65_03685 [Methanomassiliicoccales archaeon]|nr:hypothetical protein [Methanomassiliicoccales archaeon]
MDYGHWLRRLIHMSAPLFLVYYLLPEEIMGVDKRLGLVIVLVAVLAFEAMRLTFHWRILGLRDYEDRRLSAPAWAAIGLTITFLVFPVEIAAPAVIGMALTDPLIGELRRRRSGLYPALPTVFYLGLVLVTFYLLMGLSWQVLMASLVATALAISVERVRTKYVDDDFLMMVVPAVGMAVVLGLTSSFPF